MCKSLPLEYEVSGTFCAQWKCVHCAHGLRFSSLTHLATYLETITEKTVAGTFGAMERDQPCEFKSKVGTRKNSCLN